jgi:hypothetical protein
MNRSSAIDNWLFTVVVTIASRALIARDRLLRRINKVSPNDCPRQQGLRHAFASGLKILDAVLVTPADIHARAALLICHGIGETVDHWLGVQKLLTTQGVAIDRLKQSLNSGPHTRPETCVRSKFLDSGPPHRAANRAECRKLPEISGPGPAARFLFVHGIF